MRQTAKQLKARVAELEALLAKVNESADQFRRDAMRAETEIERAHAVLDHSPQVIPRASGFTMLDVAARVSILMLQGAK